MAATENFVSAFHSLSGITVGERRRSLYILLNRTQDIQQIDFSLLHPKTPLEETFKVDALIYFRNAQNLIEILKSENPILTSKVIKVGAWFWEQAFQNVTGEQLVTQLFPLISFNVKVKILNKLLLYLKNSEKADELFEAVNAKYGLYLASKILSACSVSLTMDYIEKKKIKPTPRQILAIIKRNPEVAEDILKAVNNRNIVKLYQKVFIYLSKHDPILFVKLHKEYKLPFNLGWRTTQKFVLANRQQIMASPNTYLKAVHFTQIAKTLQEEFKDFYFGLFPATIDEFYDMRAKLLSTISYLPTKMRNAQLYVSTFKKAYGQSIWNDDRAVSVNLLKMLTPDQRGKITGFNYKPHFKTEEQWSCYWKTNKSIPFLKKKISLTSDIKARADLIILLVKTCALNSDELALAHVCKYMTTKHRNDSIAVRLAFLKTLQSKFKLENLEEEHWAHIHELLDIFAMNNEEFYESQNFLVAYIHHRLKNNLDIKEQVIKWIKQEPDSLNILKEHPHYEKEILLMCGEIIPQLFEESKLATMHDCFLSALVSWNKRHRDDPISLFTYTKAMESFKNMIGEETYGYKTEKKIAYFVHLKDNVNERIELLKLIVKSPHFDKKILTSLIHREPLFVIENIDVIAPLTLKKDLTTLFLMFCKNYSHLEVPQKIVKVALSMYQEQTDVIITTNTISALSYLMPTNEFLTFIVPYYPSNLQAKPVEKEGRKMITAQKKIGDCLRNLNPASLAIDNILHFVKNSSFSLIGSSVFSLCANLNEVKLVPFVEELTKRPTLIRKYALYLSSGMLDKPLKNRILHLFMENERKPSIRKFMFKSVFNSFIKNADDYSWELAQSNLQVLDLNNEEIFELLLQVDKIPSQYAIPYVVLTWELLKASSVKNANSKRAKIFNLLTPEMIDLMPKQFCDNLIKDHLLRYYEDAQIQPSGQSWFDRSKKKEEILQFQPVVQSFTCRYIIYSNSESEQHERLKLTFEVIKDYIATRWHDPAVRLESRKCTIDFLQNFCLEFLTNKCQNISGLVKFADYWNNLLKPHEAFDEYLHLQFTLIYVKKLPPKETAKEILKLCDSVVEMYGVTLVEKFCNKLNSFIKYFVNYSKTYEEEKEDRYIFVENLVMPGSSLTCEILVILLLNRNHPVTDSSKERCKAVIEELEKKEDPVILLYLNRGFRGV